VESSGEPLDDSSRMKRDVVATFLFIYFLSHAVENVIKVYILFCILLINNKSLGLPKTGVY
jgi:hypothetical protein